MAYVLAIGDRAYSSWSLRGWLAFAQVRHPGDGAAGAALLAGVRAAAGGGVRRGAHGAGAQDRGGGRRDRALGHPRHRRDAGGAASRARALAGAPAARALARTLAAEMHASFGALRAACPMNLRRAYAGFAPDEAVLADLARIEALWALARAAHGGTGPGSSAPTRWPTSSSRRWRRGSPPTACRWAPAAMDYVAAHLADPAFLAWRAEGLADPFVQPRYDLDLPERAWPGPAA